MHVLIGIAVGYVLSLIVGVGLDTILRLPPGYAGLVGLIVWAWSAWGISRSVKRGIAGRRRARLYGGKISPDAAYLIDRFEAGERLTSASIDYLIGYFRSRPIALAALREKKSAIAAAIVQFFPEDEQSESADVPDDEIYSSVLEASASHSSRRAETPVASPASTHTHERPRRTVKLGVPTLVGAALMLATVSVGTTVLLTGHAGPEDATVTMTAPLESSVPEEGSWESSSEVTAICQAAESSAKATWCFEFARALAADDCSIEVFRRGMSASTSGRDQYEEALFTAMGADGCAHKTPEARAFLRAEELRLEYGGPKQVWVDLLGSSDCAFLDERRERYELRQSTAESEHIVNMYNGYLGAITERSAELGC